MASKRVQVVLDERLGADVHALILAESKRLGRVVNVSEYLRTVIQEHIKSSKDERTRGR